MFTSNREIHEIETMNRNKIAYISNTTAGAQNVLKHLIPKLLGESPDEITENAKTNSVSAFVKHPKCHIIDSNSPNCTTSQCYICKILNKCYDLVQKRHSFIASAMQ